MPKQAVHHRVLQKECKESANKKVEEKMLMSYMNIHLILFQIGRGYHFMNNAWAGGIVNTLTLI